MAAEFVLRFDGLDARAHRVDMRLLGRSMIGVDEAIHRGLWAAVLPEVPRGRKRIELSVQVGAPRTACVELHGAIVAVAGVLPFGYEVAVNLGADYIKHLLSAVLLWHGGRRTEAGSHIDRMLEIVQEQQQSLVEDRQLERKAVQRMHDSSLRAVVDVVQLMQPQAKQIVSPIGPTADQLRIGGGAPDATVIDVAIADAVRSGEPVEVGDMEEFSVRIDQLTKHNRQARVEIASDPGRYLPADIRDPAYDGFPNIYSEAFNNDRGLVVQAKPTHRPTGELIRLHILNARAA